MEKIRRFVKLSTYVTLVSRVRMSGTKTLIPLYVFIVWIQILFYIRNVQRLLFHVFNSTGWSKSLCAPDDYSTIIRCTENFRSPCRMSMLPCTDTGLCNASQHPWCSQASSYIKTHTKLNYYGSFYRDCTTFYWTILLSRRLINMITILTWVNYDRSSLL